MRRPARLCLSLCVVLLAALAHGRAQLPTPAGFADWTIDEHANWRVQLGDNPAWASPTFDDSHWQSFDLHDQLTSDPPAYHGNARWYRIHLHLPPEGPVDLFLIGHTGSYELYLDGRLITAPIRNSLLWRTTSPTVFPLRAASGQTDVVLAVRSHYYRQEYFSRPELLTAMVGSPTAIRARDTARRGTNLGLGGVGIAVFSATFLIGFALVALFFQQRAHPEYLWLGLTFITGALQTGLLDAVGADAVTPSTNAFLGDPCTYLCIIAQIEFVFAFTGRRAGRLLRAYELVLVLIAVIGEPFIWNALVPVGMMDIVENGVVLPGVILVVATLVVLWRRGNREAGLLIAPMLLFNLSGFVFDSLDLFQEFHPGVTFSQAFTLGIVDFDFWSISQVIFLAVIGLVLFRRFTQVSRDQAIAQSELESARTIQQVLIPEALPDIPHLHIESVYHPAQQVGGDFFQIIPAADSTLVVLGDVSGKGLPAAMNVALLVGAIRTCAEITNSPAGILATLNRRLLGRTTGFATCLALRVHADGRVAIANAGHLNPYLAGTELEVANGLPLGLTPDATYAETALTLAPHQTLTLLTDGVPEARNPQTGALFGFDRTANISTHTAQSIAAEARTFGQEDDIAVLTLQFLPS